MAPVRRSMEGRGLPGWYAWVIVLVTMVLLSGGAMAVAINSSNKAVRAEREARIAAEQEQARGDAQLRLVTCTVVNAQVEAYRDPPPITPAGKNAAQTWRELRVKLKCE